MEKKSNRISVLGLGQMGMKIAQLYKAAGYEVSVWNRSDSKAKGLTQAAVTKTASDAIKASTISVVCVSDNDAVSGLLEKLTDKNVLNGKVLINLTTGSPLEADKLEKLLSGYGGKYINGALQVAPDQMGLETTTVLLSGDENAYRQSKAALQILGGNLKYLGAKAAASSAMDLASLTWLYGSYVGLIYGAKLSQAYGLDLTDYSNLIGEVTPGFTDFFKHEIGVISKGDFRVSQSPLAISVAATQRIAAAFQNLNIMSGFPGALAGILEKARQDGLENKELAAIINVIGQQES